MIGENGNLMWSQDREAFLALADELIKEDGNLCVMVVR
jgi:hypothetical protein